jgi:hypothetical protein
MNSVDLKQSYNIWVEQNDTNTDKLQLMKI